MTRLAVGIVGCGGRARGHMQALQQFDDVAMVAVCDPIAAARDAAGDEFGVAHRYASVADMLDGEHLDAAFVATPTHINAQGALPCLEHGVHTLVEKPPGMNVAEARALRDAAERSGAKGIVGFQRRFNAVLVEARRLVEARGPIVQLVGEFHQSMSRTEAGGTFPPVVLENILLETPIHAIDLLCALAGSDVAEVHSVVRRALHRYVDVYAAQIVFENGCVAHLIANYTTDARLQRYEIHGRDISAYLEGISEGVVFSDGERHTLTLGGRNDTADQARFFLDCIKEDRPVTLPAATLDEGIKTMQLAEAILAGRELEGAAS